MKRRIGWIAAILAVLLAAMLLVWRLWPVPAQKLLAEDGKAVTAVSAGMMAHRVENGQPFIDLYSLELDAQQDAAIGKIVEMLQTSQYRRDFRNLLPWAPGHVDADEHFDGRTVTLMLWMDEKEAHVQITFLSGKIITVYDGSRERLRIYHPTHQETLDELVRYIQENGVKE